MAAVRLSCVARNGRSPGEESLTAAIVVQAIEAQPAFGQIKPMRGQVLACAEQHFGDVPGSDRLTQEELHSRRRKRRPGVKKGGHVPARRTGPMRTLRATGSSPPDEIPQPSRNVGEDPRCRGDVRRTDIRSQPTDGQTRQVTCPWIVAQSATGLDQTQRSL